MKIDEKDYIYLVWKDPVERDNYIIGELSKNGSYEFRYFKECNHLKNFDPLIAFPDINKVYKNNNMFASFSARLPDKRRPEIKTILQRYKLKEYDEFELLKKTGGVQPIDTFIFIDPILDIDETFIERSFFISGIRRHEYCNAKHCVAYVDLKINDILDIECEPENKSDPYAVKISYKNNFIGYVPRYFSKPISECIKKNRKIKCEVIYINPDKKKCQECVKVNLTIEK